MIFVQLRNLPVHRSMREISELIYETCKTYLVTQGKFIMILWLFIGAIAAIYFGFLAETVNDAGGVEHGFPPVKVLVILLFSLVGIAGSYGVAWFGIRVNTFANSRTAFASLEGRDRKSTRLNSSHANISYAVFCLKKKNSDTYPYRFS